MLRQPPSTTISSPKDARTVILDNIGNNNIPYRTEKLAFHLSTPEYKAALLKRIESSSLTELINIEITTKKIDISAHTDFTTALNTKLIDTIKNTSSDTICSLSPTQLHHCYYYQYQDIAPQLRKLNRKQLDKILIEASQQSFDEKAIPSSITSSLTSLITGDYSMAGMIKELKNMKETAARTQLKKINDEIQLRKFIYIKPYQDDAKREINFERCKVDDAMLAAVYKSHQHDPATLAVKLTTIFNNTSQKDYEEKSVSIKMKKSYDETGSHDFTAYFQYATEPSVCCLLSCATTAIEQESNAQERQKKLIASQIETLSDVFTSIDSKFKQESIYLKPLLNDIPNVNPILLDSFFLTLLESNIINPADDIATADENLTALENTFTQCANKLKAHYNEVNRIFVDAINIVEEEYKRLLTDRGHYFKTNGSHKAAIVLETLNLIASNTANYLMNPDDTINSLRTNIYCSINYCLKTPIISAHRNSTADTLIAVLGVLLFLPTLGATYWCDIMRNTFFGPTRVVGNLTVSAETVRNTNSLI